MKRVYSYSVKRLIALIAVCVAAFALCGCGASLTVYDYSEGGVRYNMYELSIDNEVIENMERTAATDRNGEKYTVQGYFYALFTGFGYELVGAELTEKTYTVRYRKAVSALSDLETAGSAVAFETTYTENPFYRTYSAVSPNPFNGVRAAYDDAKPLQSSTVIEQLKNGIVARDEFGELVNVFPSIQDAFPCLKGADLDGLLLNYVRSSSSRTKSSGNSTAAGDNTTDFVFSRYFDRSETTIAFEYDRPVPYGWYMVAIAAGAVTLVIFAIVTRTKKQKPTLLDRFPYNPEEYRDYDSNLPSKLY